MFQAQDIRRSARNQSALMKNQQVITGLYLVKQMSGPEHADALLATQRPQVLVEGPAAGRIKSDAGLVEQ